MSSSSQAPPRKNKGRQKVKMEKMENESNLQVTFSKRRTGLFKKASELGTLCGAQSAIVVFSPASKVFSYGDPDVESVTNRFLNGDRPETNASFQQMIVEANRSSKVRNLNMELTGLQRELAIEKKQGEELDLVKKTGQAQGWYPPAIEDFNLEGLQIFEKSISNFKKHFDEETAKFMSLNPNAPTGFSDINELYATVGNVTNNPGWSGFDPNNNPSFSLGFDATGFSDTGLYATDGIRFADDIGSGSDPNGFNNLMAGFGDTGVYGTVGMTVENNMASGSGPNVFNNFVTGFSDTGVYGTGGTSVPNNLGAQDPYDPMGLVPYDLSRAANYDPNAPGGVAYPNVPGGVADPYRTGTGEPSNAVFHGNCGFGAYHGGFNDGSGPSQF